MNNLTLLYQLQEVESDNDSYLNDTVIQFIFVQGLCLTRIVALLIFEVERHKYIINNNSTL